MKVIAKAGRNDIATVYIAESKDGSLIEFVESIQPPLTIYDKWVLIISTLKGCPIGCRFCDAGGSYKGILSFDELSFQIDYMIRQKFPDFQIPSRKFKIQFARMGEPSLNPFVLDILRILPTHIQTPRLIPSISTVAPLHTDIFFRDLLDIKRSLYPDRFQLQFSIHSTDIDVRSRLIPVRTWDFQTIAEYGSLFIKGQKQKITLNFALTGDAPLEPDVLLKYFDPELFFIKITPVNPTAKAHSQGLVNPAGSRHYAVADTLKRHGYEVLISVGELEENKIGSNCGQYISRCSGADLKRGSMACYSYSIEPVAPHYH